MQRAYQVVLLLLSFSAVHPKNSNGKIETGVLPPSGTIKPGGSAEKNPSRFGEVVCSIRESHIEEIAQMVAAKMLEAHCISQPVLPTSAPKKGAEVASAEGIAMAWEWAFVSMMYHTKISEFERMCDMKNLNKECPGGWYKETIAGEWKCVMVMIGQKEEAAKKRCEKYNRMDLFYKFSSEFRVFETRDISIWYCKVKVDCEASPPPPPPMEHCPPTNYWGYKNSTRDDNVVTVAIRELQGGILSRCLRGVTEVSGYKEQIDRGLYNYAFFLDMWHCSREFLSCEKENGEKEFCCMVLSTNDGEKFEVDWKQSNCVRDRIKNKKSENPITKKHIPV